MREFIDKTSVRKGTPINREYLMAIQGFDNKTISFESDGSVVETNGLYETLTTEFMKDGSIVETFEGDYTLRKTITFGTDGTISEVTSWEE